MFQSLSCCASRLEALTKNSIELKKMRSRLLVSQDRSCVASEYQFFLIRSRALDAP